MKKFAFLGLIMVLFTNIASANAGKPQPLGTYDDWSAYYYYENGAKVCYIASTPKKAEGNYSKRGEIFAFITHRTGENIKNEFNYITGYTYKKDYEPKVIIDGESFPLYTEGEVAWAANTAIDTKIANAIRAGNTMIVKGKSSRGTLTTDTFSLKGSSKALSKIDKECNIK